MARITIRAFQALLGSRFDDDWIKVDATFLQDKDIPRLQVWLDECLMTKLMPRAQVQVMMATRFWLFSEPLLGMTMENE